MIKENFKHMSDLGIVPYTDDILIHSLTKEEHKKLIKEVLSCLQKWDLAASNYKCNFPPIGNLILG
jgi:hypothetical protein